MTTVAETLCAIERRAERAIVQELRLMTQEFLAMRTQLTLADRAHADALLLKLTHLERCQQVDTVAPCPIAPSAASTGQGFPMLPIDSLEPLQPDRYLVHLYGHELGDLERTVLVETLASAAQLVRQHQAERPQLVWEVTHNTTTGELAFLGDDDMLVASISPCEPLTPEVEPLVADACKEFSKGSLTALRCLFITPVQVQPEPLAA